MNIERKTSRKSRINCNNLFILFFLFILNACTPTSVETQAPSLQTPRPMYSSIGTIATSTEVGDNIVAFHIYEMKNTKAQSKANFGSIVELAISAKPVTYQVIHRYDESIESVSSQIWKPHTVNKMRICTSFDEPCLLDDTWISFNAEQTFQINIDWVGTRLLWVVAQFQDTLGQTVLSIAQSGQNPRPVSQASYAIVGIVDDSITTDELPLSIQAAVNATRATFPVWGSINIEDGRCCVGGVAGDTIQVDVAFKGESSLGKVKAMRIRTGNECFTEDDMIANKWEPFVTKKTYPVKVTSNWVGFYISVQYHDAKGNLSAVYCDDISVEGYVPLPP